MVTENPITNKFEHEQASAILGALAVSPEEITPEQERSFLKLWKSLDEKIKNPATRGDLTSDEFNFYNKYSEKFMPNTSPKPKKPKPLTNQASKTKNQKPKTKLEGKKNPEKFTEEEINKAYEYVQSILDNASLDGRTDKEIEDLKKALEEFYLLRLTIRSSVKEKDASYMKTADLMRYKKLGSFIDTALPKNTLNQAGNPDAFTDAARVADRLPIIDVAEKTFDKVLDITKNDEVEKPKKPKKPEKVKHYKTNPGKQDRVRVLQPDGSYKYWQAELGGDGELTHYNLVGEAVDGNFSPISAEEEKNTVHEDEKGPSTKTNHSEKHSSDIAALEQKAQDLFHEMNRVFRKHGKGHSEHVKAKQKWQEATKKVQNFYVQEKNDTIAGTGQEYRDNLAEKVKNLHEQGKNEQAEALLKTEQEGARYKKALEGHRENQKEKRALVGEMKRRAELLGLKLGVEMTAGQNPDDADLQDAIDKAAEKVNEQKPASKPKTIFEQKDILDKRRQNHQSKIDTLEERANLSKEEKDELIFLKEKVEILEKRISKTKDKIFEIQNKNTGTLEKLGKRFKHNWGKFQTWYAKPENKKELHKRIKWTFIGMGAVGLASTGAGALLGLGIGAGNAMVTGLAAKSGLGIIGAGATRFAGGYAGGELFRRVYEGNKKDYRQHMAERRAAGIKDYHEDSVDFIRNKNRWRTIFDRAGRMAGAFGVKGIDSLLFGQGTAETVAGEATEKMITDSGVETADVSQNIESTQVGISKDIFIHKNEGITHAFERQINASEELRNALGVKGDTVTGNELARIAKDFGYIKDNGADVRVFMGEGAGYELSLDKNGVVSVIEHKGGHIEGDFYVGGHESDVQGHHYSGQEFEGSEIEKQYEYLGDGKSSSATSHSGHNYLGHHGDNSGVDMSGIHEGSLGHSGNLFSETGIREYPGGGGFRYHTTETLGEDFGNLPADLYLRELFIDNGLSLNGESLKKLGFEFRDAEWGEGNLYHIESGTSFNQKEIYKLIDIDAAKTKLGLLNNHSGGGGFFTDVSNQGTGGSFTDVAPGQNQTEFNPENNFGLISDNQNTGGGSFTDVAPGQNQTGFSTEGLEADPASEGPVSVVRDVQGNIEIHMNQDYHFSGDNDPSKISMRDLKNIRLGNYEKGLIVNGKVGPFQNIELLQTNDGSFILKHDSVDQFSSRLGKSLKVMENESQEFMNTLGLNTSKIAHLAGSSDVYTRLTEDQANHIMTVYQDLRSDIQELAPNYSFGDSGMANIVSPENAHPDSIPDVYYDEGVPQPREFPNESMTDLVKESNNPIEYAGDPNNPEEIIPEEPSADLGQLSQESLKTGKIPISEILGDPKDVGDKFITTHGNFNVYQKKLLNDIITKTYYPEGGNDISFVEYSSTDNNIFAFDNNGDGFINRYIESEGLSIYQGMDLEDIKENFESIKDFGLTSGIKERIIDFSQVDGKEVMTIIHNGEITESTDPTEILAARKEIIQKILN